MNNQNLVIYECDELYNILIEIRKNINLNLQKASKNDIYKIKSQTDCLILTQDKISGLDNLIVFNNFPISILKLLAFFALMRMIVNHVQLKRKRLHGLPS